MLSFDNFIKLYTGIPCDFDGSYGTQCMDLVHFYKFLVLGIYDKTTLSAPTAFQTWALNYPTLFKKIPNIWGDPNNFPKRGDIIVWGTVVGSAGHIAIVNKADGISFQSFDANWPVGSYPKLVNHTYTGVVGWFRPLVTSDNSSEELKIALQKVINLKTTLQSIATTASNAAK